MSNISVPDKIVAYITLAIARKYTSNRERSQDLGISEANASRYNRFQSGLGVDVALKIAEAKFGGSFDAMRKAAEEWWENEGLGMVISEMPDKMQESIKQAYPHADIIQYATRIAKKDGISEASIARGATLAALDDPPILDTEEDRSRYVSRLLTAIQSLDEPIMLSRKHSAKSVPPAASRKRR